MSEIVLDDAVTVGSLIGDEEYVQGSTFEVHDPGRLDELVGTVATASASDVDRTVGVASRAQVNWAKTDVEHRAALVLRAAKEIEENSTGITVLMTRENGSLLSTSQGELLLAVAALRNAAEFGVELLAEHQSYTDPGSWVRVERRPYGVVACIVPWNAPVVLTMQKVGPALVAGNAVIVKPSPFAPLTVSVLLRHLASFFPPGVINVVHGDGDVGAALISHPSVRKISFTGGPETAKKIMRSGAESLTRVHFELGGNDPAIVLDDADLDFAADAIAHQAFRRAGQVCFAIKRVYIPTALAGEFHERMRARVDQITVGHGLNANSSMGPVNNKGQFERIRGLQERLVISDANMHITGSQLDPAGWGNGYYLQPAIIFNADPASEIVTDEQFGPILPIVSYDSEEDVIAMANSTEYGLGSSIWSSDPDRATALADRVQAGMTFINAHGLSSLGGKHIPFGGIKHSGIGWENSPHGVNEYLEFHSTNLHFQR